MRRIDSFFKLAFDKRKIADANLISFTKDHIKRLKENNHHKGYHKIILKTGVLLGQYQQLIKHKKLAMDERKNQNLKVKFYFEEIKDATRKLEALMRYQDSKYSKDYQYLFPGQLSEISKFNKITIKNIYERIQAFLKHHDENSNYKKHYDNILLLFRKYFEQRKEQYIINEEFNKLIKLKKQKCIELSKQLQKNIYIIAIHMIDNAEVANTLFNERLLYKKEARNS
ncbi:hypothetical protein [Seonamhaeicola sp.]|uniref:hypothetical protein n=1 Tax=Seonamhaeicola sp. TaxID=1912245 RepID=UPI0026109715|nr:hypothetical protein [Seonamhaeicola sp.]